MPWCPQCGVEYREGFTACSDCQVELVAEQPTQEQLGPEWVEVGTYTSEEEAELAQGFLLDAGIAAEIVDKEFRSYPVGKGIRDEILLVVPPEALEQARELLDEAASGEASTPDLGDTGENQ